MNQVTKTAIETNDLKTILSTMNVPIDRRENISIEDLRWLLHNLPRRNADHPLLKEAINRVKGLLDRFLFN